MKVQFFEDHSSHDVPVAKCYLYSEKSPDTPRDNRRGAYKNAMKVSIEINIYTSCSMKIVLFPTLDWILLIFNCKFLIFFLFILRKQSITSKISKSNTVHSNMLP